MPDRNYVALGSSYAAGLGLSPSVDRLAGRSERNYPHLVAKALGASLTDVTVGGATTATILRDSQRVLGRVYPPQVQAVTAATDLVTITAGGNDLGYIGSVVNTAVRNRVADSRLARPLARRLWPARPLVLPSGEQIESATKGLVDIVTEVHRRALNARVVLVDYLAVFDDAPPDYRTSRLHPEQAAQLRKIGLALSGVFAEAASRSGADLVAAGDYGAGHGVGTAQPWVAGLSLRHLPGSFHPTVAGMNAVTDAVLAELE